MGFSSSVTALPPPLVVFPSDNQTQHGSSSRRNSESSAPHASSSALAAEENPAGVQLNPNDIPMRNLSRSNSVSSAHRRAAGNWQHLAKQFRPGVHVNTAAKAFAGDHSIAPADESAEKDGILGLAKEHKIKASTPAVSSKIRNLLQKNQGNYQWPSYTGTVIRHEDGRLGSDHPVINAFLEIVSKSDKFRSQIQNLPPFDNQKITLGLSEGADGCFDAFLDRYEVKEGFVRRHAGSTKISEASLTRESDGKEVGVNILLSSLRKVMENGEKAFGPQAAKMTRQGSSGPSSMVAPYNYLSNVVRISFENNARLSAVVNEARSQVPAERQEQIQHLCAATTAKMFEERVKHADINALAWGGSVFTSLAMGFTLELFLGNVMATDIFRKKLEEKGFFELPMAEKLFGNALDEVVAEGTFWQKLAWTISQSWQTAPTEYLDNILILTAIDALRESGAPTEQVAAAEEHAKSLLKTMGDIQSAVWDGMKKAPSIVWDAVKKKSADAGTAGVIAFFAALPDKGLDSVAIGSGTGAYVGRFFEKTLTGTLSVFGAAAGFYLDQNNEPEKVKVALLTAHLKGDLAWPDDILQHVQTLRDDPRNQDSLAAIDKYLMRETSYILRNNPEYRIPRQSTIVAIIAAAASSAVATGLAAVKVSAVVGHILNLALFNPIEAHAMNVLTLLRNMTRDKGLVNEFVELLGKLGKDVVENRTTAEEASTTVLKFLDTVRQRLGLHEADFGLASMGGGIVDNANFAAGAVKATFVRPEKDVRWSQLSKNVAALAAKTPDELAVAAQDDEDIEGFDPADDKTWRLSNLSNQISRINAMLQRTASSTVNAEGPGVALRDLRRHVAAGSRLNIASSIS